MRILFVSNLYPPFLQGGYEQACHDLAGTLTNRGHRVRVLTSTYRRQELHCDEPGVDRVLKLRSSWISPMAGRETALGRHRLEVDRHNVKEFKRVVAAFEPDAVMVFNAAHLGPALLWAAESHQNSSYYLCDTWLAPMLQSDRSSQSFHLQRIAYRSLLSALTVPMRRVSSHRCIFCSRALLDQYRRLGAEVQGDAVIHLAISASLFRFRPQHILTATSPRRIVYAGRLSDEKGVTTLVKSLARLGAISGLHSTTLTLIGQFHDRVYREELTTLIRDLGLDDAIELLGHRPISELPGMFAEHDVMAFPSEWEEPFALTLMQGMSVGLPVVSTLRGGAVEIVRDGRNAIAFEAENPDDLANKLAWVLSHPDEAAAIGRSASEEIRENYTLDVQAKVVENYLTERHIGLNRTIGLRERPSTKSSK